MKITLDQFCEQWVPGGSPSNILSRLEFNVFDFRTKAGEISMDHFKRSFSEIAFSGSGVRWPSRKSKWARRNGYRHPMMIDEGTLLRSIKGEKDKNNYGGVLARKLHGFTKSYTISTHERTRADRKKRGLNPLSNGSYAAIHNDPAKGSYRKNQYSKELAEQRQFIGHNAALDAKIQALIPDIFRNIPATP